MRDEIKTRFINYIGIELEGGWKAAAPNGAKHDGSVRLSETLTNFRFVGEVASPIFDPNGLGWIYWVKESFPDYSNKTCGLHVHMSFVKQLRAVSFLLEYDLVTELVHCLRTWGSVNKIDSESFWERIAGNNRYCATVWHPDDIFTVDNEKRYKAINLQSLFKHKTIEFRILPMFTSASIAIQAISTLIKFVERKLYHKFTTSSLDVEEKIELNPSNNSFHYATIKAL